MTFFDLLQSIQNRQQSLLCIGLDTDPSLLPPHLGSTPQAVLEFNREVIKATCDFVCAYKMNLAFYDALGKNGWDILRETLNLIPPEILTIGDGKRADIGNRSGRRGLPTTPLIAWAELRNVQPQQRIEERTVLLAQSVGASLGAAMPIFEQAGPREERTNSPRRFVRMPPWG